MHLAHPAPISIGTHRASPAMWITALAAAAAVVALVLVLAIGGSDTSSVSAAPAASNAALRSDGGPEESNVAGAVGTQVSATVDSHHAGLGHPNP